jgi:hypothetical protein
MSIDISEFDKINEPLGDEPAVTFAEATTVLDQYAFASELAAALSFGERQLLLHARFRGHPKEFTRAKQRGKFIPTAYWGVGTDAWYTRSTRYGLYHLWSPPPVTDYSATTADEFADIIGALRGTGRHQEARNALFSRFLTNNNEFVRTSRMDDRWQWNQAYNLDLSEELGDFDRYREQVANV